MKLLVMATVAGLALGGVAQAQSSTARQGTWYVEGVAQSAFGNVTSQSFGGEAGVTVWRGVQVFVDVGRVADAAPGGLGVSAQTIASFLAQSHTGVGFQAREPVTFGVAGLKYPIPVAAKVEPYMLGGAGIARPKKDVKFSVATTDVTADLGQYGVVLGFDLSGTETKAMISVGGGVMWPVWREMVVDLQYRFGHASTSSGSLNVNRAGIGIGVRFSKAWCTSLRRLSRSGQSG